VYHKTARELLGDQASGNAGEPGLKTFPQALGRYTANPSDDR
jgi:hypothetical protein